MDVIRQFFGHLFAFLSVAPFVSFFAIWGIVYGITKDKRKATRFSVDVTTVLLLGAVSRMNGVAFWIVVFVLLFGAGLIGRAQNRKYGVIRIAKMLKLLSRGGFLLLSPLYFILLVIGIAKAMAAG